MTESRTRRAAAFGIHAGIVVAGAAIGVVPGYVASCTFLAPVVNNGPAIHGG